MHDLPAQRIHSFTAFLPLTRASLWCLRAPQLPAMILQTRLKRFSGTNHPVCSLPSSWAYSQSLHCFQSEISLHFPANPWTCFIRCSEIFHQENKRLTKGKDWGRPAMAGDCNSRKRLSRWQDWAGFCSHWNMMEEGVAFRQNAR